MYVINKRRLREAVNLQSYTATWASDQPNRIKLPLPLALELEVETERRSIKIDDYSLAARSSIFV